MGFPVDLSVLRDVGNLATIITMIIAIIGIIVDSLRKTHPAFEQVRRCRRLSTRVAQHVSEYKKRLTVYTLCLSDKEKDVDNIEKILYYDSNILQDLAEFAESGCPELDREIRRRIVALGAASIFYIVFGLLVSGKSILTAVFYIGIGLVLLYNIGSPNFDAVRQFTLDLDDKEMQFEYLVKRLGELRELCLERGEKI